MSCNIRILYGFSVMIQKQFFAYFSSFPRRSNISILIFYIYFKSCVWLLLVAVTLPITSASRERSFSKMKLLKKLPRNSMNSERLGKVDVSGVSRLWQAWHMPWAPLWRGAQKLLGKIKIFIYSFFNLYFAPHAFINCKAASLLCK